MKVTKRHLTVSIFNTMYENLGSFLRLFANVLMDLKAVISGRSSDVSAVISALVLIRDKNTCCVVLMVMTAVLLIDDSYSV